MIKQHIHAKNITEMAYALGENKGCYLEDYNTKKGQIQKYAIAAQDVKECLKKYYKNFMVKNVLNVEYQPDDNIVNHYWMKAQSYHGNTTEKKTGYPVSVIADRAMTSTEIVGTIFAPAMLDPRSLEFEIANVRNAAVLRQIAEGGQAYIQKPSSKIIKVPVHTFGGGSAIDWETYFQRKYNEISLILEDLVEAKRRTIYQEHLKVITEMTADNIAYQAGDTDERKLINTINAMYLAMRHKLEHKVSSFPTTPVYLLANADLKMRIAQAVNAKTTTGAPLLLESMIRFVFVSTGVANNKIYLIYPGRSFRSVIRMGREAESVTVHPLSRSMNFVTWLQIGCVGADSDQLITGDVS